jgi:hypothetical protein
VIRPVLVALVVVLAVPAAALGRPEPGGWAGPPVAADGARAVVRFTVDEGTGLVQPVVRYRVRRCGHGRVALGLAAARGRRFEVSVRRSRLRLRVVGRFDAAYEAHGSVQGRVRGCRIPRLRWTAEQGWTPNSASDEPEEIPDEELEDGEELEEDDFDEDGEPIEDEVP